MLKLGYQPPLAWRALLQFLTTRGTPRSEMRVANQYLRTARIGGCHGWIAASPDTRKNLLRVELAPALRPVLAQLQQIIDRGLTRRRAETVHTLARAVADNRLILEPAAGRDLTMAGLAEIPGIGPWTSQYIAMRALADPDAFPSSDLALLRAFQIKRPAQLETAAEPWRPWRAYAAMHLWHGMAAGG